MLYRTNGELKISRIGLGTRTLYSSDDLQSMFDSALFNGVNFVDTAPLYQRGESERAVGKLIADRRGEIVVSTKVGTHGQKRALSADNIAESLYRSLRRLNTDYIDIVHVHYPDPRADYHETCEVLRDFIRKGYVRYYGLSNFDRRQLRRWPMDEPPLTMQLPYSLLQHSQYETMLGDLRKQNIIPVVYSPLAGGLLAHRGAENETAQLFRSALSDEGRDRLEEFFAHCSEYGVCPAAAAVAWSLNAAENVVLTGMSSRSHVEQNLTALNLLNSEIVGGLEAIPEPVVIIGGVISRVIKREKSETLVEVVLKDLSAAIAIWTSGNAEPGWEMELNGLTGKPIE